MLSSYLIFFSAAEFVVTHSLKKKEKNVFHQKIEYMNAHISKGTVNTFRLNRRRFKQKIGDQYYGTTPIIIEFLANRDYKKTVNDFNLFKKRMRWVEIVLFSIISIILTVEFI